jgi:hypothetical protein
LDPVRGGEPQYFVGEEPPAVITADVLDRGVRKDKVELGISKDAAEVTRVRDDRCEPAPPRSYWVQGFTRVIRKS